MSAFPFFSSQSRGNANSAFVIINGRRVPVGAGLRGCELVDMAKAGRGRRAVLIGGGRTRQIEPNRVYKPTDLTDKHGQPRKITSMPDRTKGGSLYAGRRADYSRALITEQVYDVAANFVRGNVDFDEDNADWLVIPEFRLPPAWDYASAALMIVFPREYPTTPPIGFYLPSELRSPNGHFYGTAYHGAEQAPTLEGWSWYCCTVNAGAWRPHPARFSGEWKRGDNLWTYITLINEVLGSPLDAD